MSLEMATHAFLADQYLPTYSGLDFYRIQNAVKMRSIVACWFHTLLPCLAKESLCPTWSVHMPGAVDW